MGESRHLVPSVMSKHCASSRVESTSVHAKNVFMYSSLRTMTTKRTVTNVKKRTRRRALCSSTISLTQVHIAVRAQQLT